MTEITRIGIDTSKSVFTLHGVDGAGRAVLRRNLRRRELLPSLKSCRRSRWRWKRAAVHITGGAQLGALGHRVQLIPPQGA